MSIEDFSLKKKYSFKRFGYEISALFFIFFLITCIDKKLGIFEYSLFLISIFFLILTLIEAKILKKFQTIFNKFFFYISKIINPLLMIIVYIISIIPMALLFKSMRLFSKKVAKDSFWVKEKKNINNINFNDQF